MEKVKDVLEKLKYSFFQSSEKIEIRHQVLEMCVYLHKRLEDNGIDNFLDLEKKIIQIDKDNSDKLEKKDEEISFIFKKVVKEKKKEVVKENIQRGLNVSSTYENVKHLYEVNPFFYDKNGFYFVWDSKKKCWIEADKVDLMNAVDEELDFKGQTVSSKINGEYLEAIKRIGRQNVPLKASNNFIQFNKEIFDIEKRIKLPASPDYFFRNPIPYKIGDSNKTPIMDEMIKEWVGDKYLQTVKEIIAYCCYNDYPIHILFVFTGSGSNGKSTLLRLIKKFIGTDNISSTSLDALISNRFEAYNLWGKKIAMMGETNYGLLSQTDLLKRLCGQDPITFEAKNKGAFFDINTAKLLISSNSLPTSDDTSDGFYRRWLIIDFPNQFEEGRDILQDIPEYEYENLARQCVDILPDLLERGSFTNQGSIEERKQKYILSSNPLPLFLEKYCEEGETSEYFCTVSEFYTFYCRVLKHNKKRQIKRVEVVKVMTENGYEYTKTTRGDVNGWMFIGIKLKDDYKMMGLELHSFIKEQEINANNAKNALLPTQLLHVRDGVETRAFSAFLELQEYFTKNHQITKQELMEKYDPLEIMNWLEKGYLMEAKKDVFKANF